MQMLIPLHLPEPVLAKMPGCIPKQDTTILQPNLSPPVRLRQKSEGKARLFLSGDDKNERLTRFQRLLFPLPLAEQKRIVAKLEELLPLCERLK